MITNEIIIINESEAGERLDICIHNRFSQLSRRAIQSSIKEGKTLLNGIPAKKGNKVLENDNIRILEIAEAQDLVPVVNPALSLDIIYEDENILAINKPAGMPCHPISSDEKNTVVNFILHRYPETSEFGFSAMEPAILHRLDINTSGILLAAKNEDTFKSVRKQMSDKKIIKIYLALVLGEMDDDVTVAYPLIHHENDKRKMKAVDNCNRKGRQRKGKNFFNAQTEFKRIKKFNGYTLVQAQIVTGVMHQIRCHLASIKHPVAGDWLYQSSRQRKHDLLKPKRHLLHAHKVILTPSATGEQKIITASLPEDFNEYILKLE